MKLTNKDLYSIIGGLGILIILICSFYDIGSGNTIEKIINDLFNGSIQILDTKTGKPIVFPFTKDLINKWNTFYPVIATFKYIPFVGIVLMTIYIAFFTKFQKPANPFKRRNNFDK